MLMDTRASSWALSRRAALQRLCCHVLGSNTPSLLGMARQPAQKFPVAAKKHAVVAKGSLKVVLSMEKWCLERFICRGLFRSFMQAEEKAATLFFVDFGLKSEKKPCR